MADASAGNIFLTSGLNLSCRIGMSGAVNVLSMKVRIEAIATSRRMSLRRLVRSVRTPRADSKSEWSSGMPFAAYVVSAFARALNASSIWRRIFVASSSESWRSCTDARSSMRFASGMREVRKSAAIFSEPCILSDWLGMSDSSVLSRRALIVGSFPTFSAMSAKSQTSV